MVPGCKERIAIMSSSSYANCHFCGDIVKKDVANTKDCPTCLSKKKHCTHCGQPKETSDFRYIPGRDSLDHEDPYSEICSECMEAIKVANSEPSGKGTAPIKVTDAERGMISLYKVGLSNDQIAKQLGVKEATLTTMRYRLNRKLKKQKITIESYPHASV